jgi:hypothetical protein
VELPSMLTVAGVPANGSQSVLPVVLVHPDRSIVARAATAKTGSFMVMGSRSTAPPAGSTLPQ